MSEHARLNASASARWLSCPPSVALCEEYPDESSTYAKEGTDAHALCAYEVEKALGRDAANPIESLDFYDSEMQECADGYAAFVLEEYEGIKRDCPDATLLVEQRVDYDKWVPEGFGTADCIILADGTIEVIDYKHGLGVLVSAKTDSFGGNPQLMCYCLGVLQMFDGIYDIKTMRMAIYQPRRNNVSIHTMEKEELLRWADETLAPAALLAEKGEGDFSSGPHCIFCKAKATCRERARENMELARYEFRKPPTLCDAEIDEILLKAGELSTWASDVKEYALAKALSGTKYQHFKVVEGRSSRRYKDEDAVAERVQAEGFDPYEYKVLGVTAMTKLLGKKRFEEVLGGLIVKPQGKPTLVPMSDKRPALKDTAVNDFKEV